MKSEYEIQAEQFAKNHGVKLHVLETSWGKYFPDDWQERYIFKLRLTRGRKSYTFTFGQSIAAGSQPPTMYDVLTCFTKSDPGTFEDFCDEFGYNTDSRTAERVYKAVCKEWKAVERLFGDVLEELQEIN